MALWYLRLKIAFCLLLFISYRVFAQDGPSIVIIGAGLSGLTAAFELKKLGFSPIIFEASSKVGGRMRSVRSKEWHMPLEHGGTFINSNHKEYRRLLDELQVKTIKIAQSTKSNYYQIYDDKLSYSDDNFLEFKSVIKNIAKISQAPRKNLKEISAQELLEQSGASGKLKMLLEQSVRNEHGADLRDLSAEVLLETMSVDVAAKKFSIDGSLGDEGFILHNGSKPLFDRLQEVIACPISFNHELTDIAAETGHYVLTFNDAWHKKVIKADYVIVTIPLPILRTKVSLKVPDIPQGFYDFMNDTELGINQKLFLLFNKPVWRDVALREKFVMISSHGWIWENSDDAQGYPYVGLTVALGGSAPALLKKVGVEVYVERLLQDLSLISSAFKSHYVGHVVGTSWLEEKHAMGSYTGMRRPHVNRHNGDMEFCFGNLCFAGEAFSDEKNRGYMNGAVKSGQHAAHHLKTRVALSSPSLKQ